MFEIFGLIILALIFEGLRRKILARMHNRTGPPIIQPFYDFQKLFTKEWTSGKNLVFHFVPPLALLCALLMLFIVPFPFWNFDYSFLVLGYLFILQDTFYIFGALASGSPFGTHSSIREVILMVGYEIALLVLITVFFFNYGAVDFTSYTKEFAFLEMPVASFLLLMVGMVIVRVTPYDVVNAEPEISAGFFTEYYGIELAMLELAEFIKNLVFLILIGFLLVGPSYAIIFSPIFLIIYTISNASSPRSSTFLSLKMFVLVASIAFIDLFFLV